MICPRCGVGRVGEGIVECAVCGYAAPERDDISLSVAEELERQARRELDREFDILRLVGRGGHSVVYLAQERELGREVALKLLPLHLAMGDDAPDRFKREAKIAASLDHPHIVPVHRVGATPRFLWYTMKFVRGRSLADILSDGARLDVDETVQIVAEVASALQYAHQRGVVHRDVKPGNVMLDETGWAWVGDFGVAKAFGSLPLTQTGGALGTPAYMSPEQCYGKPLDGRADQYALAIVTYECLAGRPPFVADSVGEYVRLHCGEPPGNLRLARPDIPDHVADTLTRALSKEPDDRFGSVIEFAQALGADLTSRRSIPVVASTDAPTTLATPTTPYPHASPAGRWSAMPMLRVGAYIGVGAVLGMLLLTLPGRDSDRSLPADTAAPASDTTTTPAVLPPPELPLPQLMITTDPLGRLFIDGQYVSDSRTPNPLPLEPGRHMIRVEREGFATYEHTIEVVRGDTARFLDIVLTPLQPAER